MNRVDEYMRMEGQLETIVEAGLGDTQIHLDQETEQLVLWQEMTEEEREEVKTRVAQKIIDQIKAETM